MKKATITLICFLLVFVYGQTVCADLNDGLVAYYPFNGNANDESGNGNDGTVNGATLSEDRFGNPDSAYSFDGVNDYIDIGNNVKPSLPITICVWVKVREVDNGANAACLFRNDRYDSGSYRNGVALIHNTDGCISGQIFEGYSMPSNRIGKISNDPVALPDNDWHPCAVVFNNVNDIQLFWDGQEIDGQMVGSGSSLTYSDASGAVGMHITNVGYDGPVYFNGDIDDIRVYDRALSEDEILELYNTSRTKNAMPWAPVLLLGD